MNRNSTAGYFSGLARIWLLTVCLIQFAFIGSPAATAGFVGIESKGANISTISWGAAFADVDSPPIRAPHIITWSVSTGTQYAYIDVVNVGELAVGRLGFTVSTRDQDQSRQDAPNLTFSLCNNGVWNQTSNTCSGTASILGTTSSGTINANLSLGTQSRITMQITAVKTKKSLWTSTLSISVNRTQVRTPTTTNT